VPPAHERRDTADDDVVVAQPGREAAAVGQAALPGLLALRQAEPGHRLHRHHERRHRPEGGGRCEQAPAIAQRGARQGQRHRAHPRQHAADRPHQRWHCQHQADDGQEQQRSQRHVERPERLDPAGGHRGAADEPDPGDHPEDRGRAAGTLLGSAGRDAVGTDRGGPGPGPASEQRDHRRDHHGDGQRRAERQDAPGPGDHTHQPADHEADGQRQHAERDTLEQHHQPALRPAGAAQVDRSGRP
jgi:hypothetical protein